MGKSMNPMEAFRREQKKKARELKKHRQERQKDKLSKLSSMDPSELKEQLKNLERQVISNPTDGPTRKRKQELEDTLRAVVKKQKEMAEDERKRQANAPLPPPMSMTELAEANKEKFQNPENSIYYHPTLNPFGAPPPGMPQRYHKMPPPTDEPTSVSRDDQENGHLYHPDLHLRVLFKSPRGLRCRVEQFRFDHRRLRLHMLKLQAG
ncbi:WW domain-binding protein 11 [Phytophthora boehmeriae]|uniref:WW domain-binding protein 11 n=1 Tax=Phytophthora boehmeriae TaxID=109152 RepID=A0A8T1WPK3_9STRA|nr:WW domain-binding protein 11 [Phytophthora boehmeriae]